MKKRKQERTTLAEFDSQIDFMGDVFSDNEMSMVACLNRIMKCVRLKTFTKAVREELKNDLEYVGKRLNVNPEEAVLVACVLENGTGFHACDDDDISTLMGCSNIELFYYRKHIYSLAKKRIIRITKTRSGNYAYFIMKGASRAIVEDRDFLDREFSGLDTEGIFSLMRRSFKDFRFEEIDSDMLSEDLNMMINENPQNLFCKKVEASNIRELHKAEQRVFYYLCHRFVNFGERFIDLFGVNDVISDDMDEQKFFRHFQVGKTRLQTSGLVCFGGNGGVMDKSKVGLSDKVVNEFFTEVELFCETQVEGHRDLKKNEAIVAKELFYNNAEQKQIEKLEHLLEQDNFVGIQSRLGEMGMRNGFNIILYGGPGTGKTETTMQLAKKTGRDVLCIDVSALKSKWVGDSEKLVKEVFISYRRLCKTRAVKPILFFNEADAIFGKRIENVDSPAAQTLNSVQNIILQEMETIDGIMICTTNLHGNLDSAFERRFIYKVELGKPDETVRTKIWKSMLKGLNDEDYNVVAHKYPFSGGEIENVVRKATIDYILNGQAVTLDSVCNLCDEEMFRNKVRKVGF